MAGSEFHRVDDLNGSNESRKGMATKESEFRDGLYEGRREKDEITWPLYSNPHGVGGLRFEKKPTQPRRPRGGQARPWT